MLDELDTLDNYIYNLKNELNQPIIEYQNKFTLDILEDCDKMKFNLKNYNIKKVFLFDQTKILKNSNYIIINIKFKTDIIPFNKLLNIRLGNNHRFDFVLINFFLNNSCIIDNNNLYILDNQIQIFNIQEEYYNDIIDEVWIYKPRNNNLNIKFNLNFFVDDDNNYFKYENNKRIDLFMGFIQKEKNNFLVSKPNHVIIQCNDIKLEKNISLNDKIKLMEIDFYWIKNFTKSNEFINNNCYSCYIKLFNEFNQYINSQYFIFYYLIYKN